MKPPRHPLRVLSLVVPVLGAREAEALIDLLGQIQNALWEAYGDAILGQAEDDENSPEAAASQPAARNDDPPPL